jgi:hypothetical protein
MKLKQKVVVGKKKKTVAKPVVGARNGSWVRIKEELLGADRISVDQLLSLGAFKLEERRHRSTLSRLAKELKVDYLSFDHEGEVVVVLLKD